MFLQFETNLSEPIQEMEKLDFKIIIKKLLISCGQLLKNENSSLSSGAEVRILKRNMK